MKKLLHITTPHMTYKAVWEKQTSGWKCIQASPIIKWMVGKPINTISAYISKKKWTYEWFDIPKKSLIKPTKGLLKTSYSDAIKVKGIGHKTMALRYEEMRALLNQKGGE